MDTPAVVLSTLVGGLVGWFVIVRLAETIPDPSPLHPRARAAVALVNGLLWYSVDDKFTRWWIVVCYFVVFSVLLAVSVVDLRVYRIPDRIVFPALGASVVLFTGAAVAIEIDQIKYAVVGMITFFLILFVFHVVYPAGMGFGD